MEVSEHRESLVASLQYGEAGLHNMLNGTAVFQSRSKAAVLASVHGACYTKARSASHCIDERVLTDTVTGEKGCVE